MPTLNALQRHALPSLPLVIFSALLLYLALQAPVLLEPYTLNLILRQSLPTVLVCLGLATVVMVCGDDAVAGGIDLSIPASAVLAAGIVASQVAHHGTPIAWAVAMAFAAALLVGGVVATLVVLVGMTPLLASLASSVAALGITKWVVDNRRINLSEPLIVYLRDAELGGVSVSVLWVLPAVLLFYFLLHRTRWGMNLQAVGGNRDAAELSGIAARRFIAQAFVLAAATGAGAALLLLARGSGFTPGSEENLLLEMVLATYLGAAFSPRRVVTLWGAVLGAVLVSALSVGFKSIGVDIFWTGCIKGALILLVVASSALARKSAA